MSRFRIRLALGLRFCSGSRIGSDLGLQSGLGSVLRSRPGSGLRLGSDIGKVQSLGYDLGQGEGQDYCYVGLGLGLEVGWW